MSWRSWFVVRWPTCRAGDRFGPGGKLGRGPADGAILRQKEGGGQGLHSQETPERGLGGHGQQGEEAQGGLGRKQEGMDGLGPRLFLVHVAPTQGEAGGHGAQIPVGKAL